MKINEILSKYTAGEITLEQANADLKDAGTDLYLDPLKNTLTVGEIAATIVGYTPDLTYGFGLLDTGTGGLNKVTVMAGKLIDVDCGDMYALCIIGGRTYHVQGSTLTD